jgi:hypothetical protein
VGHSTPKHTRARSRWRRAVRITRSNPSKQRSAPRQRRKPAAPGWPCHIDAVSSVISRAAASGPPSTSASHTATLTGASLRRRDQKPTRRHATTAQEPRELWYHLSAVHADHSPGIVGAVMERRINRLRGCSRRIRLPEPLASPSAGRLDAGAADMAARLIPDRKPRARHANNHHNSQHSQ